MDGDGERPQDPAGAAARPGRDRPRRHRALALAAVPLRRPHARPLQRGGAQRARQLRRAGLRRAGSPDARRARGLHRRHHVAREGGPARPRRRHRVLAGRAGGPHGGGRARAVRPDGRPQRRGRHQGRRHEGAGRRARGDAAAHGPPRLARALRLARGRAAAAAGHSGPRRPQPLRLPLLRGRCDLPAHDELRDLGDRLALMRPGR